jgi:MshEN domain
MHSFGFIERISRLPITLKATKCSGAHCDFRYAHMGRQRHGIRLQGEWYCSAACFERAIVDRLKEVAAVQFRRVISHRMPLGLVLFSRGAITKSQLAAALCAQRTCGHGKIGEWLQSTGAAQELEITRALSQQWGLPILKSCSVDVQAAGLLPIEIISTYRMLPFHFSTNPRVLYVALSDGISHAALAATEAMLDCRTDACLITPSTMNRHLEQVRTSIIKREVVFQRDQSEMEKAATIRSYAVECSATSARLENSGEHIWVRLSGRHDLDLLFRLH